MSPSSNRPSAARFRYPRQFVPTGQASWHSMLHWSQDASTGWTRNSWRGSIAKVEDVPFAAVRSRGGRAGHDAMGSRPVGPIYHPRLGLRKAAGSGQTGCRRAPASGPTDRRELTTAESAATLHGGWRVARWVEEGSEVVTASEFVFLAKIG